MVRKIVLSIIAVLAVAFVAFAQNLQVTGTVTDGSGNPVVGAAVFVEGTTVGTTTGVDGSFKLQVPVDGNLYVSFMGYEDQKIAVNGKSVVNVVLKDDYQAIDEVVVQTFGEVKKKDLTGSITAVTSKDLQKMTVSSVTRALEGAVAGVTTYSTSGQPGNDASIIIRGMGSLNASSEALIVVDGVPYSSSLSTINPLDIESVVVSKDAAANALYGSRAANGVVFVTTKKGARNQKANITFEAKWGWNEIGVKEHQLMNPKQYYEYSYESIKNYYADMLGADFAIPAAQGQLEAYGIPSFMYYIGNYMALKLPEGTPKGATPINPETGKVWDGATTLYHDNYDDYLFTKQFRQEYTLSISGGSERMDYYVSGSFLEDPSYVVNSAFKRISGRAAVNAQATKWMKVGTNVSWTRRDKDAPAYGDGSSSNNVFLWTQWQAPIVPYYARDLEGKIRYNEDGSKMLETGYGSTLSPYGETGDQFNSWAGAHPYEVFSRDIFNEVYDNVYANAYTEITFLKDFKFTANVTLDNRYQQYTVYQNSEFGIGSLPTYNGIVQRGMAFSENLNTQQLLSYKKTFADKHAVDAMIGHEFSRSKGSDIDAAKCNVFYPGIPELSNAVVDLANGGDSSTSRSAIEGYFFRGSYTYDDRYSVSASYRYDGTSRFAYAQWGNFWSVGGSWRISNEAWMDDASWVDDLRLRATYGVSGNQATTSAYPYTNLWSVGVSGGQPALSLASIGNPNLSWERNKQVDVGIDFRFWDRVYGSLDYYNRRTHDLIWNRPTPASTGLTSRLENVGILGNVGFEFDVTVDLIKNENFYWNIGFNGSFAQNKLLDYPSELGNPALGGDYVYDSYLRGKGKPWYNLYLFDYAGVNPENGKELFWKDVKDAEGNVVGRETTEEYAEATQYEIGDPMPDLVGGIRTSFRWKGLDFSAQMSYQLGGMQYDGHSSPVYGPGRVGFGVSADMADNYWTPENPNAEFPALNAAGSWKHTSYMTTALYRSASYFNLKNINVGYTLPQKWTSRIGVQSLRVFFNADNLCLVTAHDGFDPRRADDYQSGFSFPQARTFTFGLTLNM